MARKQNCILRMTVNIDLTNSKEVMFVRAMLRRLNVLHAAAKPNLMPEIMKEFKIRDTFDETRRSQPAGMNGSQRQTTPVSVPAVVPEKAVFNHHHGVWVPPVKTVKPKILRIIERKMELLDFKLDSAEAPGGVDNATDA